VWMHGSDKVRVSDVQLLNSDSNADSFVDDQLLLGPFLAALCVLVCFQVTAGGILLSIVQRKRRGSKT